MSLIPKNWATFQHYKDRAPAWIKLHRGLLDDYEFSRLPDASRALAPMLWLLASEYTDGKITASTEEIAFRLRMSERALTVGLKPLIDNGFFDDASAVLAECKQDAIPEKEREIEEQDKKEVDIRAVAKATRPSDDRFEDFWKEYPKRGSAANPKKPAKEKFARLVRAGTDPEIIIGGALRYREVEQAAGRTGSEKIAQAITWLNQERFNDYPAGASRTGGPPMPPDPSMPSDAELRAKYAKLIPENQKPEDASLHGEGGGLH